MSARYDHDDFADASPRRTAVVPPSTPRARPAARVTPAGYTLAETLIVVGLIAVLTALLLPVITRARQASRSVSCLANLRGLTGAFRLYAQDNGGRLPHPAFSGIPWERSLLKYSSAGVFACPADQELAPATHSSYDWRDTGVHNTTLAGRGLDSSNRPDAILVFDALPSWHQKSCMNVGLIDGSTLSMDQDQCINDLVTPIRP